MSDLAQCQLSLTVGDREFQFSVQQVAQALLDKISEGVPPIQQSAVNPPAVGRYWQGQGGFYAGQMRCKNGGPDYHLVLAELKSAASWCSYEGQYSRGSVRCEFDGLSNTQELITCGGTFPAARWARSVIVESHRDFYLPAKQELLHIFSNMPEKFPEASYWTSSVAESQSVWKELLGTSKPSAHVLRVEGYRRLSMSVGGGCDLFVARAVRRVVLRSGRT